LLTPSSPPSSAVIHLSKSLAVEWKDFARVNTVSPGFFDTGMGASEGVMPTALSMAVMGRTGDPRELKGVYLYLASAASSFTTGAGEYGLFGHERGHGLENRDADRDL
jgi:sorbose reductase